MLVRTAGTKYPHAFKTCSFHSFQYARRKLHFAAAKESKSQISSQRLRKEKKFSFRCSASSVYDASSSLATYNLQIGQSYRLFEECLAEMVHHIHEAPFLQLVHVANKLTFSRQSLSPQFTQHLHLSGDVVMLCQPVPEHPKTSAAVTDTSQLLIPPMSADEQYFSGRVGECCEEEQDQNQDVLRKLGNAKHQFWGLVVKSSYFPKMQGCYLLQTTTSSHRDESDDSCRCVYYSLRRVYQGQSLSDQYNASWLV